MEIDKIDLTLCRPFKDFGRGFYTTPIKKQAFTMAKELTFRELSIQISFHTEKSLKYLQKTGTYYGQ